MALMTTVWPGNVNSNSTGKLFAGGTIVAWDSDSDSPHIIRGGSLLVVDDKIEYIGVEPTIPGLPEGVEEIDVTGQIITPGFIDTHRHGWQTAFKTLGSNTTLGDYLFKYGEYAAAANFRAEDVYFGQLAGLYEALNAGVTTTLDHAHHTWSNKTAYAGLKASIESRARVFWGYTFHNIPSIGYTIAQQVPNFREIATGSMLEGTNTELAIAYDGWCLGQPEDAKLIVGLAKEFNVAAVTTHTLGGPWGVTNMPEDLIDLDILGGSIAIIFSHGAFMSARGANLLRVHNQYMSITPESEMHYGHTNPHSHLIQDQAALGVDTHFTFSTDILTQARIWLQTVRYRFYDQLLSQWHVPRNNPMSVVQAFALATRSGALALRRPDLGVIQVGAKADLVVWNARDSPALLGWADPIAAIMLHASVGDVLHVTVNGEFVKRDGKLTAERYGQVRQGFLESAERIQKLVKEVQVPPLDGEFMGLGYRFADTRKADTKRGEDDGYDKVHV